MTSPYLTTLEAAVLLRFVTPDAPDYDVMARTRGLRRLNKFLARYQDIETVKRGRDVLIDRDSLAAHLSRRRKASLQPVSSRRVKRDRSLEGADVSPQDVGVVHGESVDAPESIEQCHSVVGAR